MGRWALNFAMVLLMAHAPQALSQAEIIKREGQATLSLFRGVYILHLYGSREDMAAQHARLVRDLMDQSALDYFSKKIEYSIRNASFLKNHRLIQDILNWGIDAFFVKKLQAQLPREDQKVLTRFSLEIGMPAQDLIRAFVVPDMGQWMISKVFKHNLTWGKEIFGPVGQLGCTSFIIKNGQDLFHARNLDYEGYGLFDHSPAVIYYHPNEAGAQDYTSLSSLGLHGAGISGFNESGIEFGIHQLMSQRASLSGRPILSIAEEMLRNSHTLEEAVFFLQSQEKKFTSTWAIVLSSSIEKSAAVVEVSPGHVFVRPMTENFLYQTNHASSPLLRSQEITFNYRYYSDTRLREEHLKEIFQKSPPLSLQDSIDLITDSTHAKHGTLDYGVIDRMNNIQSLVFDTSSSLVWLGTPSATPYSKPTHGEFVPLPLNSNSSFENLPKSKKKSTPLDPTLEEAHALYRHAGQLLQDFGDYEQGIRLLEQASELRPQQSNFKLMLGLTYLKKSWMDSNQKEELIKLAHDHLLQAVQLSESSYHQSLANLFLGRIEDMFRQRSSAKNYYKKVDLSLSLALRKGAKKGLRHAFQFNDLSALSIDYMMSDVFSL